MHPQFQNCVGSSRIVIITANGATINDKISIMILDFQWLDSHRVRLYF